MADGADSGLESVVNSCAKATCIFLENASCVLPSSLMQMLFTLYNRVHDMLCQEGNRVQEGIRTGTRVFDPDEAYMTGSTELTKAVSSKVWTKLSLHSKHCRHWVPENVIGWHSACLFKSYIAIVLLPRRWPVVLWGLACTDSRNIQYLHH